MRCWLWIALLLALAGCGLPFPENQRVEGSWEIADEWQTIEFDGPLTIRRDAIQDLFLVVDGQKYEAGYEMYESYDAPTDEEDFNLRRKEDNVLWTPEVVAMGNNKTVKLKASGVNHQFPYDHEVGVGFFPDSTIHQWEAPPFPEGMQTIERIRVRSNVPVTVEAISWRVTRHPDMHACMGACFWHWLPWR